MCHNPFLLYHRGGGRGGGGDGSGTNRLTLNKVSDISKRSDKNIDMIVVCACLVSVSQSQLSARFS